MISLKSGLTTLILLSTASCSPTDASEDSISEQILQAAEAHREQVHKENRIDCECRLEEDPTRFDKLEDCPEPVWIQTVSGASSEEEITECFTKVFSQSTSEKTLRTIECHLNEISNYVACIEPLACDDEDAGYECEENYYQATEDKEKGCGQIAFEDAVRIAVECMEEKPPIQCENEFYPDYLPGDFVCDQVVDCADGSDEHEDCVYEE